MFPLIETIACINGKLQNVSYHQQRIERSLKAISGSAPTFSLNHMHPPYGMSGKIKCKLTYNDKKVLKINFEPYKVRPVNKLRIVRNNDIVYEHKHANRKKLDMLASVLKKDEDMIIIKNGFVTDSWYANLAFYDGRNWYTSNTPLLKGTKRQFLLETEQISKIRITESDLPAFERVSLINAMLDLEEVQVATQYIT